MLSWLLLGSNAPKTSLVPLDEAGPHRRVDPGQTRRRARCSWQSEGHRGVRCDHAPADQEQLVLKVYQRPPLLLQRAFFGPCPGAGTPERRHADAECARTRPVGVDEAVDHAESTWVALHASSRFAVLGVEGVAGWQGERNARQNQPPAQPRPCWRCCACRSKLASLRLPLRGHVFDRSEALRLVSTT